MPDEPASGWFSSTGRQLVLWQGRLTEAWYQLPQEEQQRLPGRVQQALDTAGGKELVICSASWANEQWPFFGVEELPDVDAVQRHTQPLAVRMITFQDIGGRLRVSSSGGVSGTVADCGTSALGEVAEFGCHAEMVNAASRTTGHLHSGALTAATAPAAGAPGRCGPAIAAARFLPGRR